MITLRPFRSLCPKKEWFLEMTIPPYDVLDDEDCRRFGENPKSCIHITRSEIHFPKGENPYQKKVYKNGRATLEEFVKKGFLVKEEEAFYIYTELFQDKTQRGLVGVIDPEDGKQGKIKVHELTLKEKQQDRTDHFYYLRCQDEPVFLFHPKAEELETFMEDYTKHHEPMADFVDEQGVRHLLHQIKEVENIHKIQKAYQGFKALYIADGHHRTASSINVCKQLEKEGLQPGLLSVIFPKNQLHIMGYHRLIKDLNGKEKDDFLHELEKDFIITPVDKPKEPKEKGTFTFLFPHQGYTVKLKEKPSNPQVSKNVDASILQEKVLAPLLNIVDIRKDPRIEFYGGSQAINQIEEKLDQGAALGILLSPVTPEDIMAVADAGEVLPPKSTWFEPKCRSGLFLYPYEE